VRARQARGVQVREAIATTTGRTQTDILVTSHPDTTVWYTSKHVSTLQPGSTSLQLSRVGTMPPWAARKKALPLASVSCRNPVQPQQILSFLGVMAWYETPSRRGLPNACRLTHMPTRQKTSMWVQA
jgi:hypothetical protein